MTSFSLSSMICTFLKRELQKRKMYANIEEIKQTGDKLSKIRKLIALYKNSLIFHKKDMWLLEQQLIRFPKWKHDDVIDALQMMYDLHTIHPKEDLSMYNVVVEYDEYGIPVYS